MTKRILILGTLDTKGEEVHFLAKLVREMGHTPIIADCGILGQPSCKPAISRDEIAEAAGISLEKIVGQQDKSAGIGAMAKGAASVVSRMYEDGRVDAVLAVGGVQGTLIGTAAMRALPLGVPKFMLSTVANGSATFGPFVGTKDIAIMHSVADISGLNALTRMVLSQAAGAIVGMAEASVPAAWPDKPVVGMTMAGVTTQCAMRARLELERLGYEVISFHCNGVGSRAMEELAGEGRLSGILEVGPHDIPDFLFGGLMPCNPDRFDLVCQRGTPIVFVPGGADFILLGPLASIPAEMRGRKLVSHNPLHTHVKANRDEMVAVGKFVGQRLGMSAGRVTVLVPVQGFSQLNCRGGPLFEPESDDGFLSGLAEGSDVASRAVIRVMKLDMHINDPAFAELAARSLDDLIRSPASVR